ncbi:DUF1499 domain-containing protein [Marinomonas transparens]|uniref:DUF1499 domain-containing protein n=1 Tax=Marinomonas transparens TaxID=2795388 RepID=A0A934JPW3_9GAMM|nr:DUF1499 domain-containing protein [Marinomonas transparens]MBJ7537603.1 DUF1499 domain-containing protein [Marinomonas transparens]
MSRYISPVLYVLLMLVGCVAFISIAGVRVGVFEPLTGFFTLTLSVIASLVLSILAALSLCICRKETNAAGKRFFSLVLVVSLVYGAMWVVFYLQKSGLPEINDITTDTITPPVYLNVGFIRSSSDNSLSYNPAWASIQQKYYPDVKPLFSTETKVVVYSAVVSLIRDNGWDMVAQYPEVGVVEATARTPIFGFRDDVVIRISTTIEGEIRVDMRSCSRIGRGDFGTNAKRIETFMSELSKALAPQRQLNAKSIY